jgi:hypothetical protein
MSDDFLLQAALADSLAFDLAQDAALAGYCS